MSATRIAPGGEHHKVVTPRHPEDHSPQDLGGSPTRPDGSGLTFPDPPRLELEETLAELTARAQDVLQAQGRLRALLRANAVVASELNLRIVLRHIVVAARDLVGARYAALGVLGRDGALEDFVHVGMGADEVETIGNPPEEDGILGLLANHPEAIRMADRDAISRTGGFLSVARPPKGGFLAVPVRVRDKAFGNLYLSESDRGRFTAEDEQLVTSLAATAGVAIENARLYEDSERRRRWQALTTESTHQLFTGGHDKPLEVVLGLASQAAAGDFAAVVRAEDEHLVVETAVGSLGEQVAGRWHPLDSSVLEPVLSAGKSVLVENYTWQGPDATDPAARIGSLIAAPLLQNRQVVAAMVVGRHVGRRGFDETDLDQLTGFTGHVGVALELDQSRTDRESLMILRDRERIAADLHDHVIQELFATGMGLQGLAQGIDAPQQRQAILQHVDAIDATIHRIRNTIFQLQLPHQTIATLQEQVLKVVEEERSLLGIPVQVEFTGQVDHAVPGGLAHDLSAVVRAGLSNVAMHARATSVRIRIDLTGGVLTLQLADDGRGMGTATPGAGLANMRLRTARHGGTLEILETPGGGTDLRWSGFTSGLAE